MYKTRTTQCLPQSDGTVERFNQTLKQPKGLIKLSLFLVKLFSCESVTNRHTYILSELLKLLLLIISTNRILSIKDDLLHKIPFNI